MKLLLKFILIRRLNIESSHHNSCVIFIFFISIVEPDEFFMLSDNRKFTLSELWQCSLKRTQRHIVQRWLTCNAKLNKTIEINNCMKTLITIIKL